MYSSGVGGVNGGSGGKGLSGKGIPGGSVSSGAGGGNSIVGLASGDVETVDIASGVPALAAGAGSGFGPVGIVGSMYLLSHILTFVSSGKAIKL